jgi:hypothetical protein
MITLFKKVAGLNTKVNPRRVEYNGEGGSTELGAAVDIMIDSSGLPFTRPSLVKTQDGDFHSLCPEGYVVSEGTIYSVNEQGDIFSTGITGLSDNKVSFCKAMGNTYYTNGEVYGGIEEDWVQTPYRGDSKTTKHHVGPFPGQHIAFFAGRMLIGVSGAVFWSGLFSIGLFHTQSFVALGKSIKMIRPVSEGVFVSTEDEVWFLKGMFPDKFIPTLVSSYPALEWSDQAPLVEGHDIGLQNPGQCALWNSPEGAILGLPTGQIVNLTKEKIALIPGVSKGFGCVIDYYFIHRSY